MEGLPEKASPVAGSSSKWKAPPSMEEVPGAAGGKRVTRVSTKQGSYDEETKAEEKAEEIETSQPKKPTMCPSCTSLATAVKELP